ncbi:MAG: hypothetical protein A2537_00350 [Candidatus Magasanikbacteria bacterium RIFOXYD2_FULL_36_9]|uniref:NADH:ubiquinone oxidoreductase-like 20kDa subunit domain-containing protein n=1 Tax=Candidatus Magasanikbacteria bacterium RIFOXYD2_FULL_36_9 TaxID=1798707 RepID=A0A1F6NYV3_9BACT|nr:MAG: hypothetical protein A2537_00350 [Candidatus Magasanikbacteria bacterium RIFOXYD2_FULL_36_9]
MNLFTKILSTPKVLVSVDKILETNDVSVVGKEIENKIKKLFNGSLAIRVVTAGSTNACEQELIALGNSYYDVDRFGVHFVASPRHADMLIVTGPVSRNMVQGLVHTYEAMPEPKIVVAVGDDAIDGGIFKGSYAVSDGANNVIPVNYQIPGDPPSPMVILKSLLSVLTDMDNKSQNK